MSSSQCRLMAAHNKRELIEISTLIDLTDKPIGLTRDEIGWSKVRSNASNCICCCSNNSITLVSREDSYILDHIPLDNIQFAQANSSLQYLALSNHSKIAIIDLVDNNIKCNCNNSTNGSPGAANFPSNVTKIVNLSAHGLTMNDIIFWRWIDDSVLAILSYEALYTCSVNQQHINHPAYTALSNRSRYLMMEKIFETHQYLSSFCQVTDIHRDTTGNLYSISSLYSTGSLLTTTTNNNNNNNATNLQATATTMVSAVRNTASNFLDSWLPMATTTTNKQQANSNNNINGNATKFASKLRPSFGSVPSKLSQLANSDHSFDSLKSERLFEHHHLKQQQQERRVNQEMMSITSTGGSGAAEEICGLVQVHCRMRNRSQLIRAHAVTFTSPLCQDLNRLSSSPSGCNYSSCAADCGNTNGNNCSHLFHHRGATSSPATTIMVAANKIGAQMRVHFVEMATYDNYPSPAHQSASPATKFDRLSDLDFPTSIVCSHVHSSDNGSYLHVALITTKHGQMYVCSVAYSTILFNVTITDDIISSAVLESNTQGLMVVCRNGQVLLVKLILAKLMRLLEESKTLRHISSSHAILNSIEVKNNSESNGNIKTANDEIVGDDSDSVRSKPDSVSSSSSSSSSASQVFVQSNGNQLSSSLDIGLEVVASTKL